MHISGLDLNLLVALDALLTEHHVSRAARRVGLSQPAMSRALGRLRTMLADPLLVRTRRGMRPTPRGLALAAPLHRILSEIDSTLAGAAPFEPSTCRRSFRIATADYGAAVIVPPLLRWLAARSPDLELEVLGLDDVVSKLERGELDFVLAPRLTTPAGVVWRRLFSERFVCVVDPRHAGSSARLSLDQFCASRHVVVAPTFRPGNPVDVALERRGRSRRIGLRVPSFLTAPLMVVGTPLVTSSPERIASMLAPGLGLRVHEPPIPLGGFTISLGWHEALRADPAHAWLREAIATVAAAC